MYITSRRHFLRNAAILSPALLTFLPSYLRAGTGSGIRIGFIGVGSWGRQYLSQALQHSKLDIRAIYDTDAGSVKEAMKLFSEAGQSRPELTHSYNTLLARTDIDAVIIGTPWQSHYEIAKAAMLAGKHVGCGPVMGTTTEEHQDIIRISKKTGKHYVTLDEQNYRSDLLAVSNMAQAGVFGEVHSIRAGARPDTLAAEQKGGAYPYPVFPAALTSAILGTAKGNPYVSLRVVEEQQQYAVKKPHPQNRDLRLVLTSGKVRTIQLITEKGQTVSLQMDAAKEQPVSSGFYIAGSLGSWLDLNNAIWLKESAAQRNNIWEAAQPHLDKYTADQDLRAFKRVKEDNSYALAINDFISAIQRPAGIKPVYAAATNSMIGTLAGLSAAKGGATIAFPNFI